MTAERYGGPVTPEDFKEHGHQLIDWIADYVENIEQQRVTSEARPGEVRSQLAEHPPTTPDGFEAVMRDVVALETLGDGQMRWESSVEQALPRALAREDELREVLLNLFENARLAEASTVRAAVRRAVTSDGSAAIAIEVTDDGHGIAADVLPRIFEPHFSTRTSGSGLGLAISRRMVESWGGEVTIESRVGVGTTVRVTLKAG